MNVQHSSKTCEWFTPPDVITRVHNVFGVISLDPASCAEANKLVGADNYYTADDNGLEKPWFESVLVNPPGGKVSGSRRSLPQQFWVKAMKELAAGNLRHMIWVCFSIEQLQNSQGLDVPSMAEFTVCIPSKRLHFVGAGNSPSHANAILYVPGRCNMTGAFVSEFGSLGRVMKPCI